MRNGNFPGKISAGNGLPTEPPAVRGKSGKGPRTKRQLRKLLERRMVERLDDGWM